MSISKKLRQKVRQDFNNRCAYCLSSQAYVFDPLEIDHILPISKGGTNDEENLCLACGMCNRHKYSRVSMVDSETALEMPLFNPRKQDWHEHFAWSESGEEIIGISAIGKNTVEVLKMNNSIAITVRKNWIIAGWHPPKLE